ncbi:MAG TPA: response regulator [Ignavibacteriales bacterium]|nr:response regulator [Ignavibacteriales bacterium]
MHLNFPENKKILYVDDEESLLIAFKAIFRKTDLEVHTLQDATKVKDYVIENGPFAVVLSDQRMPDMYGYEVLSIVKELNPNTQRILITGFSDLNDTVESVNRANISKYISKPWIELNLKDVVNESLKTYNLKEYNDFLFKELEKKTKELDSAYAELRIKNKKLDEIYNETFFKVVQLFNTYLTSANAQLKEHSKRVYNLGSFIISKLDIVEHHKWATKIALLLSHCSIYANQKKDLKLTEIYQDKDFLNSNYEFAEMISQIPNLESVGEILKYQYKNLDGTGFPEKFKVYPGNFPVGAQIIKLVNNYDIEFPGLYFDERKLDDYKNFIRNSGDINQTKMPHILKISQFVEYLKKCSKETNKYNPKIIEQIIRIFDEH